MALAGAAQSSSCRRVSKERDKDQGYKVVERLRDMYHELVPQAAAHMVCLRVVLPASGPSTSSPKIAIMINKSDESNLIGDTSYLFCNCM
ncbi:uncharacterized protein [Triticum aestivum]|uniref:uncharacterized protein isoform X2 n=1 Tax=Triticum aestivum TaxID=4565 RepID=UPI001D007530|nr:uncharacterized protein LOC123188264 isoform X2 [Triticum aestivum]